MQIPVSTKVEDAWYVDPDLLAGDPSSAEVSMDSDAPLSPDATLSLGEEDLQELEGLDVDQEDARHYMDVSLKGAVLAPDPTMEARAPAWLANLTGKLQDAFERQDSQSPSPPPPPGSLRWKVRNEAKSLPGKVATQATKAATLFEEGKVPPLALAAVSFLAGVAMTLAGVLLAI